MSDTPLPTPLPPSLSSIISDNNGPVSSGAESSPPAFAGGSTPRKSQLSVKPGGGGGQWPSMQGASGWGSN